MDWHQLEQLPEEELLLRLHALEALLDSSGWRELETCWREREQEFDALLHRENVEDVTRMQMIQTSCRLYREVLELPRQRVAYYRDLLRS